MHRTAKILLFGVILLALAPGSSRQLRAAAPGELFPETPGAPAGVPPAASATNEFPEALHPAPPVSMDPARVAPPAPFEPSAPVILPTPAAESPGPSTAADPNPLVAKVRDYCRQVEVLAANSQKLAVTTALQRLFETVIKANTPALRAANPEEAVRLDDLQRKLGDVMARAVSTDSETPGLSLDVFDKPTDWPRAMTTNLAIRACGEAWNKAAADRAHCQMQAADKAAGDLQPAIEAAIAHGDAAEAARICNIRNQYVMLTRGGPAATSPAKPVGLATQIDLLKLLDTRKDCVAGKWSRKDGALESDTTTDARVAFVYQPPEEYDYRVSFSRESGTDCIALIVVVGGQQTCWMMGATRDTMCRFETAKDAAGRVGPSTRGAHCLVAHGRYECVIQVRKTSLTLVVNGQTIGVDKANPGQRDLWAKYTMPPTWKLPDTKALGLGTYRSSFKIYTAEVKEISGHGKVLR